MSGHFITLEGGEGSGKTTQLGRLAAQLTAAGQEVVATREPGGTRLGAAVRRLLLDPASSDLDARAELLLYCADRAQHTVEVITPALERGAWVLCDRYSDATLAYQGGGRRLGIAFARSADIGCRVPDLTLLFDLPPALGLERARRRNHERELAGEARFEHEELAFHERVRTAYLELARSQPDRFRLIDASLDLESVFASASAELAAFLGSKQ